MNDPKPKKSAADIEALRWREMFQAALTGLLVKHDYHPKEGKRLASAAARMADLGIIEFYNRYTKEN